MTPERLDQIKEEIDISGKILKDPATSGESRMVANGTLSSVEHTIGMMILKGELTEDEASVAKDFLSEVKDSLSP